MLYNLHLEKKHTRKLICMYKVSDSQEAGQDRTVWSEILSEKYWVLGGRGKIWFITKNINKGQKKEKTVKKILKTEGGEENIFIVLW